MTQGVRMKYAFVAEGEGELTVPVGEIVTVVEPDVQATGWVLVATRDGRRGFVPADFVEASGAMPAPPGKAASATGARMSVAVPPAVKAMFNDEDDNSFGRPVPQQQQGMRGGGGVALWAGRDRALGGGQPRTPVPASRRWYYRDLFGDTQGPFNEAEMRERLDVQHIRPETVVVLEVGAGATQSFAEKPVREMFPSAQSAFLQPPLLAGGVKERCWYYEDGARIEQGPFGDAQMRTWLDDGYFGSATRVREATSSSSSGLRSLGEIFPDPTLAFLGAGQQQQQQQQPAALSGAGWTDAGSVSHAPRLSQQHSIGMFDPFAGGAAAAATSGESSRAAAYNQQSGRDLLRAAIGGGDSSRMALAAAGGAGGGAGGPGGAGAARMEDTLDLFDRVGLADEPSAMDSAKATEAAGSAIRIYGRQDQWPEFKGIPTLRENPQQYPTLLYAFFTRPLNPGAGRILCYIRREIDGMSHFNYNKFTLYHEHGDVPLAVAFRHSGPVSTTFEIKILTTAREDNARAALTVAKMEVNFMGTQFLLHNAVAGHQGKARDLAVVLYEANRGSSTKGPRKMKVGIPDVEEGKTEFKTFVHGAGGGSSMLTALQAINVRDLVPLLNKPPKYNPAKKTFSLDFGGRVTRASVKNFQLVDALHDPDHRNVILQHGRVGQDKFTMDVQHPMSLLQGFAVCLSSLHQKKAVD